MSKYEKKFQRIENGNWLVKSAALMGIWILAMAVTSLLSSLGNNLGIEFLEKAGETLAGAVFVGYLALNVILYTMAGLWGYILRLFKEAFLLPWRFTPVVAFAWMFFAIQIGIGAMLAVVVELIVLFCPPLVVFLAKSHFANRCPAA